MLSVQGPGRWKEAPNCLSSSSIMAFMSAFPKIAERLQEKNINIPFICAGGAVNRAYVESYPLGVFAAKAIQGPILANKVIEGFDWRKLRENWDKLTAVKE